MHFWACIFKTKSVEKLQLKEQQNTDVFECKKCDHCTTAKDLPTIRIVVQEGNSCFVFGKLQQISFSVLCSKPRLRSNMSCPLQMQCLILEPGRNDCVGQWIVICRCAGGYPVPSAIPQPQTKYAAYLSVRYVHVMKC